MGKFELEAVYIPEASAHEKPIYIKSRGLDEGSYRRIGSSDQICTREDLDLLYQLRAKKKYDEILVENASFADFDPEAIKRYRHERAKIKSNAPELFYTASSSNLPIRTDSKPRD